MQKSQDNKVVAIQRPLAGQLFSGVVTQIEGKVIYISGQHGALEASCAKSCLVIPQIDDLVLYCVIEQYTYVTAVLSSTSIDTPSVVSLPANTELKSDCKLVIKSPQLQSVSMHHQVTSGILDVNTQRSQLITEDVEFQANVFTSIIKRSYQTFEQLFRSVSQSEQYTAGSLLQNIKHIWTAKSQQTVIAAKQDVKVDAQRIHMG